MNHIKKNTQYSFILLTDVMNMTKYKAFFTSSRYELIQK